MSAVAFIKVFPRGADSRSSGMRGPADKAGAPSLPALRESCSQCAWTQDENILEFDAEVLRSFHGSDFKKNGRFQLVKQSHFQAAVVPG